MSFFTGTVTECIYNMPTSGAALANSTTKSLISGNTTSNPPFQMPTPLWQPSYQVGRTLLIMASGTFGTTGTPTLILGGFLDPTQNSTTSQLTLGATGAFTAPGTITNGGWYMQLNVTLQQTGVSAGAYAALLNTSGFVSIGAANNATTTAASTYMIGTPQTTVSFNPMSTYFLELWATWGTASASNTVTCSQLQVFGCN